MSRLSRSPLSRASLISLLLLSVAAGPARADQAPPKAIPGEPPQALTPRVLYEFLLGEIAGARGDMGVAVEAYVDLARRTRDVRIARRATEFALLARNFPAARELAGLWQEIAPDAPEPRRILAGLDGAGTNPESLQTHLARALAESGERLPELLLGLNQTFAVYADKQRVRKAVDRLTEPYLDHAEAHIARAQAALAVDDGEAVLKELDAALVQRPDWEPAVLFKAQMLQQRRSPAAARDWLGDFVSRHPDSLAARNAYARSLVGTQEFAKAREEFRKVLKEAPDDAATAYAVAVLSLQLKDLDAAESEFLKLLELGKPDRDTVRMHLAQIALERKDYAQARQWLEAVEGDGLRADARLRVAQILAEQGGVEPARAYLEAQSGDAAVQRRFRMGEAQLLRDAGRNQEAYDYLDGLLREYPDDPDILYESAMLAERLGHSSVMEGRLRKLIALQPDYAQAYNALGYLLADRNERLPEAEKLLVRALALAPDDPYILDSVGWLYFRQGKLAESLDFLNKAYQRQADPEIAAHFGEVLWQSGRQDEARELWARAHSAHPGNEALKATMRRFLQ